MDIITYLNNKQIYIEKNILKSDNIKLDFIKQVDTIVLVQKRLINNNITFIPRINSTIGKELENFKIQIKKVEKEIKLIKNKEEKTELDNYILTEGIKLLERAKKSLNFIDKDEYYEIIRRSMRNYEVCIGRVDEGNLKLDDKGNINIRTIKYISYNLIEQDIFNYIKRIKRREHNIPVIEIIDRFIFKANLSNESRNYLIAMSNYPVESMKVLCKYRASNKEESEEWIKKLGLAVKIDGDELI